MSATVVKDTNTEFVVHLPDSKTGEKWIFQMTNTADDGVVVIVSREESGMGLEIRDPEVLRDLAQWAEIAAHRIERENGV